MRKLFACAVVLVAALFSSAAGARSAVPVIDYENVAIATGSGAFFHAAACQEAIVAAVSAGRTGWMVVRMQGGNNLMATYSARGHSVSALITCVDGAYSIRYADSVDMKYSEEGGVRYIHPFYNKWVGVLVQSIRAEFGRR